MTDKLYFGATARENQQPKTFMRTHLLTRLSAVLCLGLALFGMSHRASAQSSFVLMGLTDHVWKYENSNTDLGTAWRATNYNDAAWQSGRGILAYENGGINATIASLTNTVLDPGSLVFITRYFRTSFQLTNDTAAFSVISSNYFDDGAVVYLNGVEAFRYNMPAGNITHSTLAVAANPANEGVFIVSNLPPNLLRIGNNVIAVEVHQNATTSSDVDFGMALIVNPIPPAPLSITAQPQNLVVNESQPANLTVGVQGAPAYYRWYKDGVIIPGATLNPYNISVTTTNDAGNYFVVVSNSINSVTSSVVTVTVIPDTNAPVLLEADGTTALTNVLVSFSERVTTATATNVNNYRITNTVSGALLTISSATLVDGTNVLLATAARTPGQNYILVVNRLQDLGPRSNVISTNSSIPVRSLVRLVAFDSAYKFWDPYAGFDQEDLGTAWKEFTYNTSSPNLWGDGTSVFYNHPDSNEIPGPLGTSLSQTPGVTSYFRTGFDFTASPGGLQLSLTHIIDDGAVIYLNGNEVLRYNMPAGTINYQTTAATTIGDVARVGPTNVVFNGIRSGNNVLAVELHQSSSNNFDKVFGLQLDASVRSFVTGPVVITGGPASRCAAESSSVSFEVMQAGGLTFQWSSNGVRIAGATNPVYTIPTVTLAMAGAQYRVAVSNATSGAVSSNATLCVVADTNAPVLVSALLTTNGTVVANFSEALSVSGTTLANYRITNSSGANVAISAVSVSNNTNVVLTVGNLPAGSYFLIATNIQDRAVVPNTLSPNPSVVRIGFEGPVDIMGIAGTWKYEQSGTDLGTGWRAVGFNDSAWASGQAIFGLETAALPEPIRTPLTLGPITYYFRGTATSPVGGGRATLRLRTLLDDGAIYYLNGVEILRVRFAAGAAVAYATLAANQPVEGAFETFDVLVTNLVAGANTLAVEVHQSSVGSSDVVFGTQVTLLGVESSVVSLPFQITAQPQSRTNAVGTTATFTVAATGPGPISYQWRKGGVNIPTATSPTLTLTNVQLADSGSSYTVVVSNPNASLTSAAAILTVTNAVSCVYTPAWTNSFRLGTNELRQTLSRPTANSTTFVLTWSNPVTNSCGSNATVVLQRATALAVPASATVWSNVFTNTFGLIRVTNTVVGSNAVFYRLRVP